VLLIVADLESGGGRPELAALLGPDRHAALEQLLVRRAASWAAAVAPGRVHVAYETAGDAGDAGDAGHAGDGGDGGDGGVLRALVGASAELFPLTSGGVSERLAAAVGRVFEARGGPVLIAWPDLATWRSEHSEGALQDLADGCDISIGPVFDGGFYLIALGRPAPSLFELPGDAWRSSDAMGLALAAIQHGGLEVGLLRAERDLRWPGDVSAALADPLTDPELATILRGA
jgi:glycosyltransferase A (GT-A) superfamily protein (DUF2064 family)